MRRCLLSIILPALAGSAGAQEKGRFEARPAASYAARQTVDNVTIAVEPYKEREKQREAFGKIDLTKLGVVPVLVVIDNNTGHAVRLDRMRVSLITADRQEVDPIPAGDVERSGRVRAPDMIPRTSPIPPIPGIGRGSKRPEKDKWEIEAREFVAPVVDAGSRAYGFFYFRTGKGPDRLPGSKLYVTGLQHAPTGQDLLYFEIDLEPARKTR